MSTDRETEETLTALRALASRLDAPPAGVDRAARDAYTWRTVDAELAELCYDSDVDDQPALAGVRGGAGPRLLSFESAGATVELEVTEDQAGRRLVGQVAPPQPARLRVRHRDGVLEVQADDLGRFVAPAVPAGPVSVRCVLDDRGGGGQVVQTDWLTI